ncbi:MAG: pseudouridine synthase [Desulfurella sp.]|jgi:23S rRNA pseudouridine2605 synthase|uniref:Pseudouridine synthase n=1 Tax=Desulfurella multipotens TaxID=79269 RepID=A0A1G6NWL1_9BACT|nr:MULTISPECIES: pseudouridine synthase [Desulfurella]AHF96604.1 pseudouridine synthase [Desulfurella acetivorans A63]HEX14288.1 rRNA pseudouridine synthase [Desulfurella acetivorans]PMP65023.1 MAG: rRNA pseudouridine synthase [Desulfurella multipotens]PMP87268.1 MAG: rRNA pseudouridine synthase [Desulfurella sp.]SDC71555.1 23S rRNA pseudouridine2605 synthase [Desulfurella multipotens]
MRLNRYLAACGLGSRRKTEELIKNGLISVNGEIVRDFIDIDPRSENVLYKGKPIKLQDKLYFAFYKPPFVISSLKDGTHRCIGDFFGHLDIRVFPVGRLDYLSEGLIFVTNDGLFANKVTHPSKKVKKTYLIKTKKQIESKLLNELSKGTILEDGFFKPLFISFTENKLWIKLVMDSGRNRVIRRFFKKFDIGIDVLKRISIGGIKLGNLAPGEYRLLEESEILQLTQSK